MARCRKSHWNERLWRGICVIHKEQGSPMNTPAITPNLRILGLFAHPDDEVFVAGGTLAKYAAEGAEIMVISSTRGQAGQIRDSRIATRRTLGAVREQELRMSSERLGVQHALCWDYGDGMLQGLGPEHLIR